MFNLKNDKKGAVGCLLVSAITFVIIIALIGGGIAVLLNMTPEGLGIAEVKIQGVTLTELGLGQTKIKDIIKNFKSLVNVKEADVVQNGYDDKVEADKAEGNLGSVLPSVGEGEKKEPDFTTIIQNPVFYDKQYLISYDDTTIAYIFNKIIEQSVIKADNTTSTEGQKGLEFIKKINGKINEISVIKNADGSFELRIVLSVSLADFKADIAKELGSLSNIVPIPEKVFLVSRRELSANAEGKIETKDISLSIGGNENNPLNKALMKIINKVAASQSSNSAEEIDTKFINDKIGQGFAEVIAHLGKIGTATTVSEEDNTVTEGSEILGAVGLDKGKITVITNVDNAQV